MVAYIHGLRLPHFNSNFEQSSERDPSCVDDPKGEWRITDGEAILNEFWHMTEKYPKLCSVKISHDAPCSADKYGEKFVSECLKPFDAEEFFRGIQGKTLSLIGDSLTSQLFERTLCSIAPFAEAHVDTIERRVNDRGPKD